MILAQKTFWPQILQLKGSVQERELVLVEGVLLHADAHFLNSSVIYCMFDHSIHSLVVQQLSTWDGKKTCPHGATCLHLSPDCSLV